MLSIFFLNVMYSDMHLDLILKNHVRVSGTHIKFAWKVNLEKLKLEILMKFRIWKTGLQTFFNSALLILKNIINIIKNRVDFICLSMALIGYTYIVFEIE